MENQSTKLDKAVKISIIVGVLILALSFAFYFVYFLPNKTSQQQKLDKEKQELKQECARWALDKSKRNETKYDPGAYNDYFERCLREKGL